MNGLEEKINAFVAEKLDGYIPDANVGKVIHDPIWGSVFFAAWEIRLIDSPLIQRLRDIHQLGMADLTYTAARHSRFEHSLGTAAIAGRMTEQLKQRFTEYEITERDCNTVRLAAILHDVGHCFYSHLSERVYGEMPEFTALMNEKNVKASPHEFMSYLIITSSSFAEFFEKYIDFPDAGDCRELLLRAANMVVGKTNYDKNGCGMTFMTSIINGEFDADKLDYTQRDSYTAGLAMTYGVDRFLMKLMLYKTEREGAPDYVLAVESDALTTIEELIFNRSVLFVYMYRHQKVLATEAALRDVVMGMKDVGLLRDPSDFLKYTDTDIESFDTSERVPFEEDNNLLPLGQMIKRVKSRRLPKRVAEYSLEKLDSDGNGVDKVRALIEKMNADPSAVRKMLYERLCDAYFSHGKIVDFTLFDIYPVFPPMIKTSTNFTLISRDGKARSTGDKKYIHDWTEAFAAEKWRGYVFCNTNIDRSIASEAVNSADI